MTRRGDEAAARIRAAIAYADLKVPEVAAALGVSDTTVSRMQAGTAAIDERQWLALADACDVPPEFMELGFDPLATGSVSERVEALERQLGTVLRRLSSVERREMPGRLGRLGEAGPTSAEGPAEEEPPAAEGSGPGSGR